MAIVDSTPLRSSVLADGELTAREAERVEWDVIVVGTGMGGGMLGYRLARSGRRVLFVEKGHSTLPGTPGTIRAAIPELAEPLSARSTEAYYDALGPGRTHHRRDRRHQRALPEAVRAVHRQWHRRVVGPVRHGLRTILRCAISLPARISATPANPLCPRPGRSAMTRWRPGIPRPKSCYGFVANPIPCARKPPRSGCPRAPPFSPENQALVNYLVGRGLHPYHLPMACDYTDDCATCQTYLCEKSCKNDAARNGVLPAVAEHGAQLLAQCRVVRLEADRTQVTRVICQRRSDMLALKAKVVVLAAGALATPVLLLNSRSGEWPRGLANGSDWVGRNLMRHLLDPIEIWPQRDSKITAANKEIGLNDFYFSDGQKYGTVQSFGAIPPMQWLTNRPDWRGKALRLMSPAVRQIYQRIFTGGLVLAAMTEDLPYLDNRVLPYDRPSTDGRQRLRMQYRLHPSEIERRAAFLRQLKEVLQPFRNLSLGSGEDNANLGHVCGTCRFGTDPKTSVLDPQNRAHEVDNLYVVDTSFFPSSAGLNPSLTVAANALRVAAHVNEAHFAT